MIKITPESYIEALKMANHYHGVQKYFGAPYIKHLLSVAKVLKDYGWNPVIYPELHIAAILHDILDDTPCSYIEIKLKFGDQIADIVYAVTEELGKTKKDRVEKTVPKVKSNYNAFIIKLADKVALIREVQPLEAIKEDYKLFREKYYEQSLDGKMQMMWAEIDAKLGG